MISEAASTSSPPALVNWYRQVRERTGALTRGLSAEDMMLQSMPDASPLKWHLAHTSWFFDQFILKDFQSPYRAYNPDFHFLFNSYYDSVGARHPRPIRGLLSRPELDTVWDYRLHVDEAIGSLLARGDSDINRLAVIGLHHEMQHQELMLTDIKHALWQNPLCLEKVEPTLTEKRANAEAFISIEEALTHIGASGSDFYYDCEAPRHRVWIPGFSIRQTPIRNAEWLSFMEDGGYENPQLWLSDGWDCRIQRNWQSPLYWHRDDEGRWWTLAHQCLEPVDWNAPVCHISYYEADAFCRWAGWRLPTEQEWEHASRTHASSIEGHFAESDRWLPIPESGQSSTTLKQLFGSVWEWTASAFSPYQGFNPELGPLGEYNGKFMANQFVLRGGSCATARAQMRHSYRNFFYPHQRWQFSGVRPARR